MHPLTDALPDHMDALALRQACGEIEERLTRERDKFQRIAAEHLASFQLEGEDHASTLVRLEDMTDERDALRAEVESLRKDAARYRWLRHGDNDEQVICRGPVDMSHVYLLRAAKLDAAIDAALTPAEDRGPSKEWCARMAELEGDSEIGAGPMANVMPAEEPQCCGRPAVGAEYMGAQEQVCCGNYEPAEEPKT